MGDLAARLQDAYAVRGESIEVGRALIDGTVAPEAVIRFPWGQVRSVARWSCIRCRRRRLLTVAALMPR